MAYQSPIYLQTKNVLRIEQRITVDGDNSGAHYNKEKKIFEVDDTIVLKIGKKQYRMVEYHFHMPSEHIINNNKFPSELHYVFLEIDQNSPFLPRCCPDICGCQFDNIELGTNILVVGRTIKDASDQFVFKPLDLSKIQPKIPHHYFEYDGTLTTGDYSPVRWIVGENPIEININDISGFEKPARPIQKFDGRIVLFHS